jgi:hypothetical protein
MRYRWNCGEVWVVPGDDDPAHAARRLQMIA